MTRSCGDPRPAAPLCQRRTGGKGGEKRRSGLSDLHLESGVIPLLSTRRRQNNQAQRKPGFLVQTLSSFYQLKMKDGVMNVVQAGGQACVSLLRCIRHRSGGTRFKCGSAGLLPHPQPSLTGWDTCVLHAAVRLESCSSFSSEADGSHTAARTRTHAHTRAPVSSQKKSDHIRSSGRSAGPGSVARLHSGSQISEARDLKQAHAS